MKRFLSALTAFCLCASTMVSTVPASALYLKDTTAVMEQADGDFTWYVDDATFDPANDKFVIIPVRVVNDPGIATYNIQLLLDGVPATEAGWKVARIEQGDAYSFSAFMGNPDLGKVGAAAVGESSIVDGKAIDFFAADKASVVNFYLQPVDASNLKEKYDLSINPEHGSFEVANAALEQLSPNLVGGTLTVVCGEPSTEEPSDDATSTPSGDYLIGDVNDNGEVELVDVVMLNRYLTKYEEQDLNAKQIVQANAMRGADETHESSTAANLDGTDSVEILRYLIGKVTSLPTVQ